MKTVGKTYLIASAGTLIPAWIGGALIEAGNIFDPADYKTLLGLIFLVLSIWGTSFAFFYLGKIKYGIISGFGKLAVIFVSIFIYELTQNNGHPYIVFLGFVAMMIWGIVDFILLYFKVKEQ